MSIRRQFEHLVRNRFAILLVTCLFIPSLAQATTYWVSPSGNDSNPGTQAEPFKTPQQGANVAVAGDTVNLESGTYSITPTPNTVLNITSSGTANAPITFQSAPGQHAVINSTGDYYGIQIYGNYITINDIEVAGNVQSLTLAEAQNNWNTRTDFNGTYDAVGIGIGSELGPSTLPVHDTIENCIVHDNPQAGISSIESDYVMIKNNVVYNNSWYSGYDSSGISVYSSQNSDSNTGYKIFVTGNLTYNNKNLVGIYGTSITNITDGEGLILDDNMGDQQGLPPYTGRILVANNIAYSNGGPGIEVYDTSHTDLYENTTYSNLTVDSNTEGDIWFSKDSNASATTDLNAMNNIVVSAASGHAIVTNVTGTIDYNDMWSTGSTSGLSKIGAHDQIINPKLANPTTNFAPTNASPTFVKSGANYANNGVVSPDFHGNTRPHTNAGLGAIQYQSVSSSGTVIVTGQQIVDAQYNVWTISNGVVLENGADAGYSANVIALAYVNGNIYQENSAYGWWVWEGNDNWTSTSNPIGASPSGTTITGTAGQYIMDSQGNVWTLSNQIVLENGVDAGYSANVIELAYVSGQIYQENSSNDWWVWEGNGNWTSTSNPL